MAIDSEITRNVEQVRNATYGKDVREAIARGLELCYGYTSGETADEAAQRANEAADRVEGMIDDSEQAVHDVQEALTDLDYIVEVSPSTPTHSTNKIWIQPQDDTEYKVATFGAYEELWRRMNEFDATYGEGHGGIKSIALDSEYVDQEDPLRKRYVITYSDETTGEFFVEDGPRGEQGPVDTIEDTKIWFKKVSPQNFTPTPPAKPYSDNLPALDPGDYLWTITEITYASGTRAYLYGFTRMGLNGADGQDGSGAVDGVYIGEDGAKMTGQVHLPVDQVPSAGSGSLLTSGVVHTAPAQKADLNGPTFTGSPSAPTPALTDNSTRLATTEFVRGVAGAFRMLEVTMNQASLTIQDESITENTYCLFAGLSAGTFATSLNWTTTAGQLELTTIKAPGSPVTFQVLLTEINSSLSSN